MIDAACEHGARLQDDRERGQGGLFGDLRRRRRTAAGCAGLDPAAAAPWTETEQLGFEKETLGLYWSGHPVDRYASALQAFGARSIDGARRRAGGAGQRRRAGARAAGSRSSPTRAWAASSRPAGS
jgi:DNA polymerase III alpha subunit